MGWGIWAKFCTDKSNHTLLFLQCSFPRPGDSSRKLNDLIHNSASTARKLLKLFVRCQVTAQLEVLLSSLLYALHHRCWTQAFCSTHHTLHSFPSVLPLPFCSCSFNNSTSAFKSTFSYSTETNFPFPNCNRLSQIGCSSPQGPSYSNLNVALDVLLPWQIANAFSAFINASSAMKVYCSHTRISFRWPTSLYFPLDG